MTRRGRLMAALTMPLLLLLTGCASLTADVVIEDVDSMDLSYELSIKDEWGKDSYDSAQEMCTGELEQLGEAYGSVFAELSTEGYEEEGTWGCRGSGTVDPSAAGDEVQLTEADGEYHLVVAPDEIIPAEDAEGLFREGLEIRISFTFPGTVLEASQGTWVGDRADIAHLRSIYDGVEIRAEAGSDLPWAGIVLVVVALGVLVLIAAAVVGILLYRSRRRRTATS